MQDSSGDAIARVAALGEPVRRALYEYVSASDEVSRDDAAAAVGISRNLAAFHLDRLADEGLLQTSFRRLSGRTGPGAGRPSKLYSRAADDVYVHLPPREYELAAQLMAQTIETLASFGAADALTETAESFGERLGAAVSDGADTGSMDGVQNALAIHGYEPFRDADGTIRLNNCPFHALAETHRQLVCGMNLALLDGFVRGLDAPGIQPVLDPQPGMCCVKLVHTDGP